MKNLMCIITVTLTVLAIFAWCSIFKKDKSDKFIRYYVTYQCQTTKGWLTGCIYLNSHQLKSLEDFKTVKERILELCKHNDPPITGEPLILSVIPEDIFFK